jgi:hypothetical protein
MLKIVYYNSGEGKKKEKMIQIIKKTNWLKKKKVVVNHHWLLTSFNCSIIKIKKSTTIMKLMWKINCERLIDCSYYYYFYILKK